MGRDRNSWKFLGMKAPALGLLFSLEKGKEMGKGTGMRGVLDPYLAGDRGMAHQEAGAEVSLGKTLPGKSPLRGPQRAVT